MSTIKAVVLDIGGVLEISVDGTEPTQPFDEVIRRWETRLGLRAHELTTYLETTSADGLTGRITYEAWTEGLRAILHADERALEQLLADLWNLYLGQLNIELCAWFEGLRPRYRTALLSNSFIGAREQEDARYAFAKKTDLIVYSHEEGIAKPSPGIYKMMLQKLDLAPHEVVFLDDVEAYVAGAAQVGIHAIRYESNEQAIHAIDAILAGG